MDTLATYALIAVFVGLALIPIGVIIALLPFGFWGGIGKALFGRGGADDSQAVTLLHPYAQPDAKGFFPEEQLNQPFSKQNKAS